MPRNMVLIILDSVSFEALRLSQTPILDRYYLYKNVWSNASWTLPSHTSMLTGLLPHEHNNTNFHWKLEKDVPYLPDQLSALGYHCYGEYFMPYLDSAFGFNRGFELYECYADPKVPLLRFQSLKEPYFIFWNVGFCHTPYMVSQEESDAINEECIRFVNDPLNPNKPFLNYLRGLQIQAIRFCDELVGKVISQLPGNPFIIITADHGDMFGENGQLGHSFSIDQRLLHVPFITNVAMSFDTWTMFDLREIYNLLYSTATGTRPGEVVLREPGIAVAEMMGCPVKNMSQGMRLAVRASRQKHAPVFQWREWREDGDRYLGDSTLDTTETAPARDALFERLKRSMIEYKQRLVDTDSMLQHPIELMKSTGTVSDKMKERLKLLGYM